MRAWLVFILLGVVACPKADKPAEPPKADPRVATAKATIGPFKKQMKQALMNAVAKEGPVAAIEVCKVDAPKITAEAAASGVTIGRSALRLRNPTNAAPTWLKPILQKMSVAPKKDARPEVALLPDGALGYVEPLYTGGICLTCHGPQLKPEVEAAIDTAYPKDAARGFAADEFRGVIWAVVP